MTTTDAETLENVNMPVAKDDLEIVPFGITVNVNMNLVPTQRELTQLEMELTMLVI